MFNPREENGKFGHLYLFHKRLYLGDRDHTYKTGDFGGWDHMEAHIMEEEGAVLFLDVWAYQHGDIILKGGETNPFNCRFDSGKIGFFWVTEEEIRAAFPDVERREAENLCIQRMKAEIESYSDYLSDDGEY
jgi:hypothetical protein